MATDLPQVSYKHQVKSGRNQDGTRHDGAGDPLMGLDRITTEDWEIGRVVGHMSLHYLHDDTSIFYPIRQWRSQQHHDAGLDRIVIFGEIQNPPGGGGSYSLEYRLGDGGAWTAFGLPGTGLTQWYAGSAFGVYYLDVSSVIEDWVTVRITVEDEVAIYDLGGWIESTAVPVL